MNELHSTQIIDSDVPGGASVVIARDSFATDLVPFMQESFRRTVLVHHGYGALRAGLVLRIKPDILVYEVVERGLVWGFDSSP